MSASAPLTHAWKDRRGSDRMVVGFTITYAISTYHHIAAGLDMGVSGWYQYQYGKCHVWCGKFHVIIYLLHIFHWLLFKHCLLYCRKDLWTDKLRKKKSLRELPLFESSFRKISNNVDLYNDVRKTLKSTQDVDIWMEIPIQHDVYIWDNYFPMC